MYPQLRTTPIAGARLTSHLRALVLLFGTYIPPLASLGGSANLPPPNRATRIPEDVLTDVLVEQIKTRCCFVGDPMDELYVPPAEPSGDIPASDPPPPSSDAPSEASMDIDCSSSPTRSSSPSKQTAPTRAPQTHLEALSSLYTRHSTATDLTLRVTPPAGPPGTQPTGRGTVMIPGWIRERGAEVMFEGGDVDESSVAEVILDSLLKVKFSDSQRSCMPMLIFHQGTRGSS